MESVGASNYGAADLPIAPRPARQVPECIRALVWQVAPKAIEQQISVSGEGYRLIKGCGDYEEARLWLLEDEYEPILFQRHFVNAKGASEAIDGRLASDEIR